MSEQGNSNSGGGGGGGNTGLALIVGANAEDWNGAVASPAQAAELNATPGVVPAPAAEVVIAPSKG